MVSRLRRVHRSILFVVCMLLQVGFLEAEEEVSIRGLVRDDDTGQPLPGATVELKGTEMGTIAGEDGKFSMHLEELPATIEVRHIGYDPQEVMIFLAGKGELEIRLTPMVYEMEGVVVEYQDPAVRAMREVIRRKRDWWLHLRTYMAEMYTRQTLFSDNDLVGIRETVAGVYRDWRRGAREVVKAKRNTSNVPKELREFAAGDYAANLYADEVEIMDLRVMGVTHPKALRNYWFQLMGEEEREDGLYYSIAVRPREGLAHGFAGHLLVSAEEYGLVEARLRVVPPIQSPIFLTEQGISFSFEQTFGWFEPGAYLPVSLRYEIEGRFGTSAMGEGIKRLRGVPTPRGRLQGMMLWRGQRAGVELPEFFFLEGGELQVAREAEQRAELFDLYYEELPLSLRESTAYAHLRRRPRPPGAASALFALYGKRVVWRDLPPHEVGPLSESSAIGDEVVTAVIEGASGIGVGKLEGNRFVPEFGYELWFNRVDGAHLGLKGKSRVGERLALYGKGGYDVGSEKVFYGFGFRQGLGKEKMGFAGASYRVGTRPRYRSESYTLASNSLPLLLSFDDYFDYYRSRRFAVEGGGRKGESAVRASFNHEKQRSLVKQTDFDLVCGFQNENGRLYELLCEDRDDPQRENPAVEEGRLRSLELGYSWGGVYRPFGQRDQKRLAVEVEHSGSWLGSDFDFTRYRLSLDWHTDALIRRWRVGETLHLHLLGGGASGELPTTRYGALDAGIWIFQPFGTLRTLGDRPYEGEGYGVLFWEVDIGGGLFERLGMKGLVRRGLELVVHGASGRTWIGKERLEGLGYQPRYADEFHHEAGLSLVLRPLRLDITRRLDRSGWSVGFSLARGTD